MRGQLSAEMLILITVVLAIVAIAATQLLNTAGDTAKNVNDSTSVISDMSIPCSDDADCKKMCSSSKGKCGSNSICDCE